VRLPCITGPRDLRKPAARKTLIPGLISTPFDVPQSPWLASDSTYFDRLLPQFEPTGRAMKTHSPAVFCTRRSQWRFFTSLIVVLK